MGFHRFESPTQFGCGRYSWVSRKLAKATYRNAFTTAWAHRSNDFCLTARVSTRALWGAQETVWARGHGKRHATWAAEEDVQPESKNPMPQKREGEKGAKWEIPPRSAPAVAIQQRQPSKKSKIPKRKPTR